MRKLLILFASLALLNGKAANATPWMEMGDAGDFFDTAQQITGIHDGIIGTLTDGSDAGDMFTFSWGGGLFEVETTGALFDTELFLWDASRSLLDADDDGAPSINICDDDDGFPDFLCSLISINIPQGTYFLGISPFNSSADDGVFNLGTTVISAPGNYTIALNGNVSGIASIPEPAPIAVMLFGLFILIRKRLIEA